MSVLRILHFSDIHFGQGKPGFWEPHDDVREEVLADLTRVLSDNVVGGRANLLLVTGDVAQKGAEAEFKRAAEWLEKVKDVACTSDVIVRTVPGNHDVNLQHLSEEGRQVQDALRAEPTVEKAYNYLASAGQQAEALLAPKLADYQSFAFAYGSDFPSFGQPSTVTTIELPGGKGIRLIGLCTVLVSDLTDDKGRMLLGRNQYSISRDPLYEDVVMMHHPTEWLKDRHEAEQYLRSRARILVTGHEHSPQMSVIERDNGFRQIELAAGALNPPGSEAGYGYCFNWIEMKWVPDGDEQLLSVTVFPRRWQPDRTAFTADYARLAGADRRQMSLSCGRRYPVRPEAQPVPAQPSRELEAIESTDAPNPILQAADTDMLPPSVNQEDYERLRFLFWNYVSKAERVEILIQLGLLTEHARKRLPSGFERMAFDAAGDQDGLHALWEATMPHVPESERDTNPFPGGKDA